MLATAAHPSTSSLGSTPTSPNFNVAFSTRPTVASSIGSSDPSRPGTPIDVLLEPPPGMSFLSYLKSWQDNHVNRWLQEYKCASQASTFAINDIRGDLLLELDNLTLKEMGITSVGDRVRILAGVKTLRSRCQRAKHSTPPPPAVTVETATLEPPENHVSDISPTQKNRRLETSRPPPLHLAYNAHSGLPRVDRHNPLSASTPESSKSAVTTPRPTPQPTSGSSSSSNRHQNLPPLPPPPRSQPPLPPPNVAPANNASSNNSRNVRPLAIPTQPHLSGRRTPTQPEASTPLSAAWNGEHGLPPRPNAGKASTQSITRSTSPLPQPQTPLNLVKRNGNSSGNAASPQPQRQSHERAYSLPGTNQMRQATTNSHPYASVSSGQVLQAPTALANQLSPIAETFMATPVSSNPPSSLASGSSSDYRVGRGPFSGATPGRPSTPSNGARSIDDIRRKTIKFHLPEEGTSRTFDLTDYEDGVKVLEKVLKKFGKLSSGTQSDVEADTAETDELTGGLIVDGWGVFLTRGHDDTQGRPLSEAELLSVCHSELDHPVREHGLTLRRVLGGKVKRSKHLVNIFGEEPPIQRTSPTSPKFPSVEQDSNTLVVPGEVKRTRRASAISILNGLGVNDVERAFESETSPAVHVSSSLRPEDKTTKPSRIRNFFGQRPPSEIITTHLQDFFPFTEKKVLERTARHSMLRQRRESNRESFMSTAGKVGWRAANLDGQQPSSRFSTSSMGSGPRTSLSEKRFSVSSPALSGGRASSEAQDSPIAAPRVSISTEDGLSRDLSLEDAQQSDTGSIASSARSTRHLLPAVNFTNDNFTESFEILPSMSQRYSQLRELRSKRDNSDAASILTVDEITAEVDSRRASMLPKAEAALEEAVRKRDSVIPPTPVDGDQTVPQEEVLLQEKEEEDELEDDEEEEEENDDEDDDVEIIDVTGSKVEEDDEDAPSKAVTSVGSRSIKWMKGALIGRGSFGSVYLAMDAQRGLLMAVKQVELPTGSSQNEERKKGMLTALEREIELLKDLQHENIVQYLDSSMDNEYLNIFLEYVPGGSVSTLLRNYGAFEELLVKNFVRQILQGLNYLHERDIIHRDIKGANILVDNKSCVKISDFGISKRVEDNLLSNKAHRPSLQGSVFWMAPEAVKQTSYTNKVDIWSLGCLCVEMLTGEHPWAKLTQMQAIFKIGSSAKPTIPSDITTEADDFMQKTFNLDHHARPSARELLRHSWTSDPSVTLVPIKPTLAPPSVMINA